MNADIFTDTNYYFSQSLKLIVYSYQQLREERLDRPYSRQEVLQVIREERGRIHVHNEIEDFLRNDMVKNYLRKLRHKFGLTCFSIQAGSEESRRNIKIGVVDIRIENISATRLDGTGFIFECKRLNKYARMQEGYLRDGMMRFINRQYYPEADMTIAGMIAFVEVEAAGIADQLKNRIGSSQQLLRTTKAFSFYPLADHSYSEIADFKYSYRSAHRRPDGVEMVIHHLLLDYYDILD
jgi:hypothetical protein